MSLSIHDCLGMTGRRWLLLPPYNVPVNGHIRSLVKIEHCEFVMASGKVVEPG